MYDDINHHRSEVKGSNAARIVFIPTFFPKQYFCMNNAPTPTIKHQKTNCINFDNLKQMPKYPDMKTKQYTAGTNIDINIAVMVKSPL